MDTVDHGTQRTFVENGHSGMLYMYSREFLRYPAFGAHFSIPIRVTIDGGDQPALGFSAIGILRVVGYSIWVFSPADVLCSYGYKAYSEA